MKRRCNQHELEENKKSAQNEMEVLPKWNQIGFDSESDFNRSEIDLRRLHVSNPPIKPCLGVSVTDQYFPANRPCGSLTFPRDLSSSPTDHGPAMDWVLWGILLCSPSSQARPPMGSLGSRMVLRDPLSDPSHAHFTGGASKVLLQRLANLVSNSW